MKQRFDENPDRACKDVDPEIFFPVKTTVRTAKPAKAVCRVCPVSRECLAYADRYGIPYGIWGGKTPHERGFKDVD